MEAAASRSTPDSEWTRTAPTSSPSSRPRSSIAESSTGTPASSTRAGSRSRLRARSRLAVSMGTSSDRLAPRTGSQEAGRALQALGGAPPTGIRLPRMPASTKARATSTSTGGRSPSWTGTASRGMAAWAPGSRAAIGSPIASTISRRSVHGVHRARTRATVRAPVSPYSRRRKSESRSVRSQSAGPSGATPWDGSPAGRMNDRSSPAPDPSARQ